MLSYENKRNLALVTLLIACVGHVKLFGISTMLSGLLNYNIVGEINVATVIGLAGIFIVERIYNKKLG